MTTTSTATAKALTIPPAGLRHEANGTVVTARYVSAAGYKVEVRTAAGYQPQLSSLHTFEDGRDGALNAYHVRCDEADAATEATKPETPAAPVAEVKPIAGNHGTTMRVSDPSHTVLAIAAMNPEGIVTRGGKPGQATDSQIRAMNRKGYMDLIPKPGGSAFAISGGRITDKGRRRLAELTAAEREAARLNAALAA